MGFQKCHDQYLDPPEDYKGDYGEIVYERIPGEKITEKEWEENEDMINGWIDECYSEHIDYDEAVHRVIEKFSEHKDEI